MRLLLLSFLFLLPTAALPGEPPNAPSALHADENGFSLDHDGARILSAASSAPVIVTTTVFAGERVEQRIRVAGQGSGPVTLKVTHTASSQAIATETSGAAQQAFPMVRTSHGNCHFTRDSCWMTFIWTAGERWI